MSNLLTLLKILNNIFFHDRPMNLRVAKNLFALFKFFDNILFHERPMNIRVVKHLFTIKLKHHSVNLVTTRVFMLKY